MKVITNLDKSNPFKLTLLSLFVSAALLATISSAAQTNGFKYDLAYPRTGDERAKPSQVFDDGRMTYIQMRKGMGSLIVFANTPSGQRKLNTRTTENCNVDCVVVEGLHDELIFVNEGFKSVAKYAGVRQTAEKTATYGAQAAAATYGAIGTNPIAPVAPPIVSNPTTLTASLGNTFNALASQFMTLASNGQGNVTGVAMSDSGSYLPTLDGTVINPPIKSGKQDAGSTAKEQDLIGLRLELKKLGANASMANDYSYAKALALLDLAHDTLRSKQGTGITEWLLHSAKAHMLAAKNKQLVSYRTAQLPGEYTRHNQDQWRDISALHQLSGLRCSNSAALLAQASVQLLAAELKRGDNLMPEAEKHENSAKQLTQQAQGIVSRCTTLATTSAELPQFAPEVQLKLTKDTLASQSLFGFDSPKLTDKAIGFLNSFVAKIKQEFMSIGVLEVIGYTDRLGSKAHNQKLSEKRADAVKNHLVTEFDQAGLKPTIISARGEGAANPVTNNCKGDKATKELVECLAPDRRVEISIKGDPRVDNYIPRSASAVNMPATVTPFNDKGAILLASSNPVSVIPAQPIMVAQNTPVQGQMNSEQRLQLLDRQRQDLLNQIEAERQTAARESLLQKMMAEAQETARRAYAAALEKMNLAQASKPAAAAPAPSAPGLQNYTVTLEDQNFRKVITKWAKQSGWTFGTNNWTPAVDIPVIAVDSMQGDFKAAVRRLLSSTELTDVALQPCFYANNVVRVVPIAEKCDRTQQ